MNVLIKKVAIVISAMVATILVLVLSIPMLYQASVAAYQKHLDYTFEAIEAKRFFDQTLRDFNWNRRVTAYFFPDHVESKLMPTLAYQDLVKSIYRMSVEDLLEDQIPTRFRAAFLEETKNDAPELRLTFLAIAQLESSNFRKLKAGPNVNGTYDEGPMGLNSANIANHKFMSTLVPNYKSYKDRMVLYMIVGIRHAREVIGEFGTDGLYVYNAGRSRYVAYKKGRTNLPTITRNYKSTVLKNLAVLKALAIEYASVHYASYIDTITSIAYGTKESKYSVPLALDESVFDTTMRAKFMSLGEDHEYYDNKQRVAVQSEEIALTLDKDYDSLTSRIISVL